MSDQRYALIAALSRELMGDAPLAEPGEDVVSPRSTGDGPEAGGTVHPAILMTPEPTSDLLRVDIIDLRETVKIGVPAHVIVEVTNRTSVIGLFQVSLLGLDAKYVTIDPPFVDLFPGERKRITVTILLPPDHPAGRRRLAVEVVNTHAEPGETPAVADFAVTVQGEPAVTLSIEPSTLEAGSSGIFIVHVVNTGNVQMDLDLAASDPERLVDVTFDPPRPRLQPGERTLVRARAHGPRPWVGMPAVRVLQVTGQTEGAQAIGVVAFMQNARLGRRLLSFIGLLLVISIFAVVITLSFRQVADLNEQNRALVQQGLGFGDELGARAVPSVVEGKVLSSSGRGVDAATIRLFREDNPTESLQSVVTDNEGTYRFPTVPDGRYLLQAEAAGYAPRWAPSAATIEDATVVEIKNGRAAAGGPRLDGVGFTLVGNPGSIAGIVLGDDVAGAQVTLRLTSSLVEELGVAVAATITTIDLDETGEFVLPELATPFTYELAVTKPGYTTEPQPIPLGPGEARERVQFLLARGAGLIGGQILTSGNVPLGGVDVVATDGTSEWTTRSLTSDDESGGTFQLRDLVTPGTYTVSFRATGYFTETLTIRLDQEGQRPSLVVPMRADTGSLKGVVAGPEGDGLGGVSVTVSGNDVERTTTTLTVGEVGAWFIDDLPAPATYTVRFARNGFVTTARTIDLKAGAEANQSGVNASLVRATSGVSGSVVDKDGKLLSGVRVTLERTDFLRTTTTSDDPAGAYRFDPVPAGSYTLTFTRAGSSPKTQLVDLQAGQPVELGSVVLEAQATIVGKVTRDGVDASDVGVVLYLARDYPEGRVAETVTDADGNFRLAGINAPESYIVDFHVPAGGPVVESREIFLQPDAEANMGTVAL